MNEQTIEGLLLLDEPALESLRTSPEDLATALGLAPVHIEALRRADRLVPRMSDVTIGTMTITGHVPGSGTTMTFETGSTITG